MVLNRFRELNTNLSASENTFIDTSTTTIAEIQTFILNCAKEGKKFIRVHNQNSPNLIFGEEGNFLITINGDGNNFVCSAINHWNAKPIEFTFQLNLGLGSWQWCNLNSNITKIPSIKHTLVNIDCPNGVAYDPPALHDKTIINIAPSASDYGCTFSYVGGLGGLRILLLDQNGEKIQVNTNVNMIVWYI